LKNAKVSDALKNEIEELNNKIEKTIEAVEASTNFKINNINSGIDRKSKKILGIVSDVLSNKLSKFLVDEILDEIIDTLNKRQG